MKIKIPKQAQEWFLLNIVLPIIIFVIKVMSLTYSFKVIGGENTTPYKNKNGRYIYAFWHRGILGPVCYYRNLGIATLISSSRDGEIAARIVKNFGFTAARGSTYKGASSGLMEIKKMAEEGHDIAMNTDGPRGPEKSVGNGSLYLSKLTGLPVIPFGFFCDRKIRLSSWDRTIIMMPFSRGLFKFGEPMTVPSTAAAGEIERCREKLTKELTRLNDECEAYFGNK